jgi:hypothetical protein
MSALPPKADIPQRRLDVRFVPIADSCTAAICYSSSRSASNSLCVCSTGGSPAFIRNPFDEIARPDEKLAERPPIGQEHAEFDNLRAVVKAQLDGAVAVG